LKRKRNEDTIGKFQQKMGRALSYHKDKQVGIISLGKYECGRN
jgi:hypothetical protein